MSFARTAFVIVSDNPYFSRTLTTIRELRSVGNWQGDIVLIAVDFTPDSAIIEEYRLKIVQFNRITITKFLSALREKPFTIPTHDGREFTKITQWEKLHVFDEWFRERYERIIYIDAGIRIFNSIDPILNLDWEGKFLAPDDGCDGNRKYFRHQLEMSNWPESIHELETLYPGILDSTYFLNCMWIYDTRLNIQKEWFTSVIEKYPIWRTNEMGVMNLILTFDKQLWTPMEITHESTPKILFDWTNRPGHPKSDYIMLKYPV
jgi:alpha-N-acetylglucosamine transferase